MSDPFKAFEAALPAIIAASPSNVMRYRDAMPDTFGNPVLYTQGPFVIRAELKSGGGESTIYDEKGSTTVFYFDVVGYGLPETVVEGGKTVPLFKTGDRLVDERGRVLRVTSPQLVRGKVMQLIAEYRDE